MRAVRGEHGFALLAALWLVAAAAVLSAGLLLPGRTDREQALVHIAEHQARAAARAGVAHALSLLSTLTSPIALEGEEAEAARLAWNRVPALAADLDSVALSGGAWYSVRLEDASGRLPVNYASERELTRLFQALGLGGRAAGIAAQSIADWRDPDDLHRADGAEWDDYYRHLQTAVRPRNGPLRDLAELADVRGIGRETLRRIQPYVTTMGTGRVNLNTAPQPVLRALPGMTRESVRVILRRRAAGRDLRNLFELESALSAPARATFQREFAALAARASLAPRSVRIEALGYTANYPGSARITALAVRSDPGVQITWSLEQ